MIQKFLFPLFANTFVQLLNAQQKISWKVQTWYMGDDLHDFCDTLQYLVAEEPRVHVGGVVGTVFLKEVLKSYEILLFCHNHAKSLLSKSQQTHFGDV